MTTFRGVKIYGLHLFVFNSKDEDAPWLPATYAPDDPNNPDDLGDIVWPQGAQPSYTAYAAFQEYENRRRSEMAVAALLTSPDRPVPPPSSVAPVRDAILNLAVTADTILYNKIQRLVFEVQRGDTNESRRNKEALWDSSKRQLDLFSRSLEGWLSFIRICDVEACEKLGFTVDDAGQQIRQPWVTLLQRLRNRFIHRSPYFLEKDFVEMRAILQLQDAGRCETVFVKFVAYVVDKLQQLVSLNIL
jgi:hypothetical protein